MTATATIPAATCQLIEQLADPACYPHATDEIRLIETHISWVFLTGPFVYKLKKPLDLGFLDYTTLEKRRWFCEEEIRVSGRFAPELYLATVPITGTPAAPRVAGDGPAIEWAVKLVQFDEADRLDARFAAGRLSVADCRQLGEEIAAVETGLAVARPADPWGSAASIREAVAINLRQLRESRSDRTEQVGAIDEWLGGRLGTLAAVIEQRRAGGRVRECHGDLHLANLVWHGGRMTAFDAIEFSPSLRWIDVANDVAFLTMDLKARGRSDLAAHVISSWMEAADDHAAAEVLPLYEVYRAVVRAAVAALRAGDAAADRADTDRYLALAERLMQPPRPVLLATVGVSGSGKTTLADRLVGAIEAVRLRSDVERKRLAGMRPTDRPADAAAEADLYGEPRTRQVYERLAGLAGRLLAAGRNVVVDAACLMRWQRAMLADAVRAAGARLVWVELLVPEAVVLERVAGRLAAGGDASDASAAIVRRQQAIREPITRDELDAEAEAGLRDDAGPAVRHLPTGENDLADPGFIARVAKATADSRHG
jgi:aminoglycoside phosphotransferase family enzyme/predicted kinase